MLAVPMMVPDAIPNDDDANPNAGSPNGDDAIAGQRAVGLD
jgi:hypothetical protein